MASTEIQTTRAHYPLSRFVRAQAGTYSTAVAEMREGTKRTHWMWFVFPQILGLGNSRNARLYAISGLDEAREYAAHDLLGPRLRECTGIMLDWAGERSPLQILGVIDAMKFYSSMTLFNVACPDDEAFGHALQTFYKGKPDQATIDRLAES